MKKILDFILSCVYLLYFGLLLVIFHGIQWIAYIFFDQKAHQKTVEWLNFFIVHGWIITGSTSSFSQKVPLQTNRSILFTANHQSMFDIPGIIWYLRKHTPLFVSKKELAKGIPSISYNLRIGHAALIDRNDPKQAIREIVKMGKYVSERTYSAAIFPEGTRSRTGKLKPFAVGGISALSRVMKDVLIVPIAIENTAKFNPKGFFPLTSFTHMKWTTLTPIEPKGKSAEEIIQEIESAIRIHLGQ